MLRVALAIENALNQNNKNTALIKEYQKKCYISLMGQPQYGTREILKRLQIVF